MKNSGHCCKTSLKQPPMTGGRRQLTSKNSGHSCKTSSKQPSMGIMSRENSRGGFPLPSSRFLPSSVLLLDSSIIDTSMQGSCQRQSCCHRAVMWSRNVAVPSNYSLLGMVRYAMGIPLLFLTQVLSKNPRKMLDVPEQKKNLT